MSETGTTINGEPVHSNGTVGNAMTDRDVAGPREAAVAALAAAIGPLYPEDAVTSKSASEMILSALDANPTAKAALARWLVADLGIVTASGRMTPEGLAALGYVRAALATEPSAGVTSEAELPDDWDEFTEGEKRSYVASVRCRHRVASGDDIRAAINRASSLNNPRLSEVEWDAVAETLATPSTSTETPTRAISSPSAGVTSEAADLRRFAEALDGAVQAALPASSVAEKVWQDRNDRWVPLPAIESAASGLPCPMRSSLTDEACVLTWGHPPASGERFHKFPPSTSTETPTPDNLWRDNGLAALDDLSHEWHNAEGGMAVGEFRARIDAIRDALEHWPETPTRVVGGGERARAVTLATWYLDDASRDPDSDVSILARQFLRCIDAATTPVPSVSDEGLSVLAAEIAKNWNGREPPTKDGAVVGWCETHDDLTWLFEDGSAKCFWAYDVETSGADCKARPLALATTSEEPVRSSVSDEGLDRLRRIEEAAREVARSDAMSQPKRTAAVQALRRALSSEPVR